MCHFNGNYVQYEIKISLKYWTSIPLLAHLQALSTEVPPRHSRYLKPKFRPHITTSSAWATGGQAFFPSFLYYLQKLSSCSSHEEKMLKRETSGTRIEKHQLRIVRMTSAQGLGQILFCCRWIANGVYFKISLTSDHSRDMQSHIKFQHRHPCLGWADQ